MFPHICIVLGGAHTSLFALETLENRDVDYLVIGEGEEPFHYLLDTLERGSRPSPVEGLAFRTEEGTHIGAPAAVPNLDDLPLPAYELLDAASYYSTFGRGGKTITLNSSRGCPYQCTFCQVLVKKYRAHSIDYIIQYVEKYYNEGFKNFYFFDDLFNITKERVIQFSHRILEKKLDIHWIFRGRVDQLDDEVCRVASKAGCEQVLLGVEDYTDANLKIIRKNITIDQAKLAVHACASYHIKTSTNWIVGLPTHKTAERLTNLADMAIEVGGDYAMFGILQVLPGCEIYRQAVSEGVFDPDDWNNFARQPTPNFCIPFYTKYLSEEQLVAGYLRCYNKFYRRPGYILQRLLKIRNFDELLRHALAGIKVLRQ